MILLHPYTLKLTIGELSDFLHHAQYFLYPKTACPHLLATLNILFIPPLGALAFRSRALNHYSALFFFLGKIAARETYLQDPYIVYPLLALSLLCFFIHMLRSSDPIEAFDTPFLKSSRPALNPEHWLIQFGIGPISLMLMGIILPFRFMLTIIQNFAFLLFISLCYFSWVFFLNKIASPLRRFSVDRSSKKHT